MYDTSRTAKGVPYFVQNDQGQTIPNPDLVRNRQVKTGGYFVESPDGNFPNGRIWSISIPDGLGPTRYPEGTLFPNPAKQNFSTRATLGRAVRRFFDAAVTLIESGDYKYGPNNSLVPSEQKQRFRRFEAMANDPTTEIWYWVESGIEAGLADKTTEGRQHLIIAMEAVSTTATVEGIKVPNEKLPRFKQHMLQVGGIHSLQDRIKQRERSRKMANGGGAGWQKGY